MKCLAQAAENLRRRDDDELVETIVVGMTVERFCDLSGEPLLGDVVPVDLLLRFAPYRRSNGASRTIGACSRVAGLSCSRICSTSSLT